MKLPYLTTSSKVTDKLFKWKYFWVKPPIFSQDFEVYGILIGQYGDHMT